MGTLAQEWMAQGEPRADPRGRADDNQLDDWLDRILDARDLSDVFGAEKHH